MEFYTDAVLKCYTCNSKVDGMNCVHSDLSVSAPWWNAVAQNCSAPNEKSCVSIVHSKYQICYLNILI